MGGVRLGGRAVVLGNPIPFMMNDEDGIAAFGYETVWCLRADGSGAYRIDATQTDLTNADQVGDPRVSPDGQTLAWTLILSDTGPGAELYTTPADGSGIPASGDLLDSYGHLPSVTMQGDWSPDGTKLVYRENNSGGSQTHKIYVIDADGSNKTLLYSVSNAAVTGLGFPGWSYDGSKIMFTQDKGTDELWTMDADGSNAAQIKTGLFAEGAEPSWANTQNVIAYWTTGGQWRIIDADGSNDTLLATDPNPFWGLTRKAWTQDDSALICAYRDPLASDPKGTITSIDTAGGGATALTGLWSRVASNKQLPMVFGPRAYWLQRLVGDVPNQIVSCLPDGSGFRVELDISASIDGYTFDANFRGFDGRSGTA